MGAKDASQLVESRVTERPYPPLPYVYTGSHFEVVTIDIPGKAPVRREKFMLSDTRSLVTNYDDGNSLLAAPSSAGRGGSAVPGGDHRGATRRQCREAVVRACRTPLTLGLSAASELELAETVVDDAALAAAFTAVFTDLPPEAMRAVGVAVALDTPAEQLLAVRSRLLEVAVAAGVWAVPVFVPAGAQTRPLPVAVRTT